MTLLVGLPKRLALVAPLFALSACGDDEPSTTASGTSGATESDSTAGPGTTGDTTADSTDGSGSVDDTSDTSATMTATTSPTTGETTGTSGTDDTTSGPTSDDSTSDTGSSGSGSESSTGGVCPQGEPVCNGNEYAECDGQGGFMNVQDCGQNTCVPDLGCVECFPGDSQCVGDTSEICNDQGQWEFGEFCDGIQGVSCDLNLGECVGACSAAQLGLNYIGCDYYPTVTQQHDSYNTAPTHQFAVAVANTSGQAANVTITQGANQITQQQVAANSVAVITLPWVNSLTKGNGPSIKVVDGAYRLRSDQPVTVYQYNPLNATTTNDASLLLPVNAWGQDYVVAAWPQWNSYPGFYAVTASRDGTVVDLSPSATGGQVKAGSGVNANGTGQVNLDEGDVLEVMSSAGDLTGTIVSASGPIQVIGGHECTNVPLNITACDHLEESLFPIDTLATEYVVVPPVQHPNNNLAKAQIIRVIATNDNTNLMFDPDQGVANVLANAGDFVEIPMTTNAFTVTADKKILVTQYMVGQSANFGTSDPAMVQTVPSEQFRSDYLFFAATTWTANYVDVVAPTGTAVTVDGANVAGWSQIGNTGFSVAHVSLSNAGNGSHTLSADEAVGITVYGIQSYGSYWYPGGLDLNLIPQ